MQNPLDLVHMLDEGVLPWCEWCRIQTNPKVPDHWHLRTAFCAKGMLRCEQRETVMDSRRTLENWFLINGDETEQAELFQYIGRLLSQEDNNMRVVQKNMKKVQKCWNCISRVLRAEHASPCVCGMFYKAMVQAILLFGGETWNLKASLMKCLEGFHLRETWQMCHKHNPRRCLDGTWTYP